MHEKQKAIKRSKNISGEHFSSTNSTGSFARKQTPTDMSRHLDGKLIKLSVTGEKVTSSCVNRIAKQNKLVVTQNFNFFADAQLKFSSWCEQRLRVKKIIAATSFPGSSFYHEVERGHWEQGCNCRPSAPGMTSQKPLNPFSPAP